jgi:hypothetical protein
MKISPATKYLSGEGWKVHVNFDNYICTYPFCKIGKVCTHIMEKGYLNIFAYLQCWAKHMRKVECYWEHVVEQNANLGKHDKKPLKT